MLIQIFADVLNREIRFTGLSQSPASGAAILGAVETGKQNSSYESIQEVIMNMTKIKKVIIRPDPHNSEIYNYFCGQYLDLHDYFGRGGNNIMRVLKKVRDEINKRMYSE